jgi:hypothetical protein
LLTASDCPVRELPPLGFGFPPPHGTGAVRRFGAELHIGTGLVSLCVKIQNNSLNGFFQKGIIFLCFNLFSIGIPE